MQKELEQAMQGMTAQHSTAQLELTTAGEPMTLWLMLRCLYKRMQCRP